MTAVQPLDPSCTMREALADSAFEIERQLGHAQDEAQRLQALLDDAIGSLVASFDALDALAQRQAAACEPLAADAATNADAARAMNGPDAADARGVLAGFTAELRRHVAAASVALQFHDIASQLGGHACRHIERARQLSGGLLAMAQAPAAAVVPVPTLPGSVAHGARWHPLSGMVGEARRSTQSSPVTHARVAAGDVELF